ncbi:mitochondrial import receptor subunit TOM40 homolog 1-like [Bradysia coprophila]|uniref:mitochondrial import receptor subunit TOM40 homolog 1-like n=1 Tax=Bradysia coprophila TaxID=38358 RepID=UPI00187DB64A|nr:mitochondrial import receptor subunit TOM40 homolog 1-like [Bradysia coprophila]
MCDPQNNATKKNPGLPQFLHIRTQEIMPFNFDGIKFIFNKSISKEFGINHVINITNGPDNGYRFGTSFTGNKEWIGLGWPTFQGEINTSGHVEASLIQQANFMRFVTVVNYENSLVFPQLTVDWIGNNSTASIAASKVTAMNYPEFVDCTYLKTVTDNLTLGLRGYYRLFNNFWPMPECLARYESGPFGWSVSISPHDMQFCHYFNVNENLRLGLMLNGQFRDRRSIGQVGYQFSCPKKQITVRGMVDSEWNVRSTVEKPLTSLPIILLLSASLNHRNNRVGLGCGVILNK